MEIIPRTMQGYIDEGKIAGISIAAMRGAELIHASCYGMLDREASKPLQPDNIFRIYSLTKPITAVAVMTLIEEGRLKLDDPISSYFPELGKMRVYSSNSAGEATYEELERPITIWHLLTHTSGLAYGFGMDNHPVEKMYQAAGFFDAIPMWQMPMEEMIRALAELPLAAQPGAKWRYSVASDVLGHLIQVVSDKPLEQFLRERIFQPLDMPDTGFFVPEEKRERFGPLYAGPPEGEMVVVDKSSDSPYLNPDVAPAGGSGLVSTVRDYLHFLTCLANGGEWRDVRLLSRDTIRQMTVNHLTEGQLPLGFARPWPGMGYGLGFGVQVAHSPESGWPVGTFGWLGGTGASAWVFPEESACTLAMAQVMFYWEPAHAFQEMVYESISR